MRAEEEQRDLVRDIALDFSDWTTEKDAFAILNDAFGDEGLEPWDPQHHLLITAALLTAYRNNGYEIDFSRALDHALELTKSIANCTCTRGDDCSLGKAARAFLTIVMDYSPDLDLTPGEKQMHLHRLTQCVLDAFPTYCRIGTRHCCKMHGFLTVEVTCAYLQENLDITMPCTPLECRHAPIHPDCHFTDCPYFK